MNIENILSIVKALQGLGFSDAIGSQVLQFASCKVPVFSVQDRIEKNKDILICQLHFERSGDEFYSCLYYDAFLRKAIDVPDVIIENIGVKDLDNKMAEIDWRIVFSKEKKLQTDKEFLQAIERIESIVTELLILESARNGKEIAECLKVKYWADIPIQEFVSLGSFKNKFEISQRFYFFDGQSGIGVEEAYRFLNNRWLEKQMQAKKKKVAGESAHVGQPKTKKKVQKKVIQST